ncbi:HNH endonuclease [Planktomarina sp.]|nr:HNH endonuclease [Planktomarina sp.]
MDYNRNELLSSLSSELKLCSLKDETFKQIIATLNSASIRPLRVIWECVVNGEVSTEKLQNEYGYNQPPRAARDVRELGFKLITSNGKTSSGKRMAIYKLDDLVNFMQKSSRKAFTKKEKELLTKTQGNICYFCMQKLLQNELQIDHKVPFEVAGNTEHENSKSDALVLLCASCNRSKSWSCEQCKNFKEKKINTCKSCYWHDPNHYNHVRTEKRLVVNLTFDKTELDLDKYSNLSNSDLHQIILKSLAEYK